MVCHGYLCRNWAGSFRYISTCGDEMDVKGLVVGGQLHLLSLLIPRRVESKRHDREETLEVLKRLDEPATPLSLEMELKSELAESRCMTRVYFKVRNIVVQPQKTCVQPLSIKDLPLWVLGFVAKKAASNIGCIEEVAITRFYGAKPPSSQRHGYGYLSPNDCNFRLLNFDCLSMNQVETVRYG